MKFLGLCVALALSSSTECTQPIEPSKSIQSVLDQAYQNIDGWGIDIVEAERVYREGGAPTYGEITYSALQKIHEILNPTKADVFYDLGSGVGKTCIQTALATPINRTVGIELSPTRVAGAQEAVSRVKESPLLKNKSVEFRHQNIVNADLSEATIVYMCSTCYSDDLMRTITDKLETLKPNTRVITLRPLPETKKFVQIKELTLPMTWSESTPVHIYRLEDSQRIVKRNRQQTGITKQQIPEKALTVKTNKIVQSNHRSNSRIKHQCGHVKPAVIQA